VESVANGKYEIGLFNMSEIVPIKGVVLAGPFPAELQNYLTFAGAIHAGSASPEPAAAYLRSLTEPAARAAWTNGGFEMLSGK
jgi:molybdate transport system substrate-binding protein